MKPWIGIIIALLFVPVIVLAQSGNWESYIWGNDVYQSMNPPPDDFLYIVMESIIAQGITEAYFFEHFAV